jgi:cell division protein FtsZ
MPRSRMDYQTLDRPTAMRRQSASRPEPQGHQMYQKAVGLDADLDFLDIPAFLRRQAD